MAGRRGSSSSATVLLEVVEVSLLVPSGCIQEKDASCCHVAECRRRLPPAAWWLCARECRLLLSWPDTGDYCPLLPLLDAEECGLLLAWVDAGECRLLLARHDAGEYRLILPRLGAGECCQLWPWFDAGECGVLLLCGRMQEKAASCCLVASCRRRLICPDSGTMWGRGHGRPLHRGPAEEVGEDL